MGRDAGHIALNAGIVLEQKKYLFRRRFRFRSFIRILKKSKASGKSSVLL
jgi:6-phosphofructokinase